MIFNILDKLWWIALSVLNVYWGIQNIRSGNDFTTSACVVAAVFSMARVIINEVKRGDLLQGKDRENR